MVVRAEIVRERVALLREALARLRSVSAGEPPDALTEWAIERGLQIAAQAVFDIGNHVLVGGFGERPAEYASVPVLLRDRAVITADLETRLRGLAGFRNLLVHDYARVDPGRVQQMLKARLDDLAGFADQIEHWLDGQSA